MSEGHAVFAPSRMHRILACPGSVRMEDGEPDDRNDYADEGTAAHFLGAHWLSNPPTEYAGRLIAVQGNGWVGWNEDCGDSQARQFRVTDEMLEAVSTYVNTVRDYAACGQLLVEQRLPIGHITGEEGAQGTGDAVILLADEIIVVDLKYGRGVEVDADDNPQLKMYGLGALEAYGLLGDFKRVRLVISQPRINTKPKEWPISVEDLVRWGEEKVKPGITHAQAVFLEHPDAVVHHLKPSTDACRFCKAKAKCPKLAQTVEERIGAQFEDLTGPFAVGPNEVLVVTSDGQGAVTGVPKHPSLDTLAHKMAACELIEDWIKAVRAAVERELFASNDVHGYKLVQAREGNRAWLNADEVEAELKAMRLKQEEMYDFSLISPTTAEKRAKAKTIGPKQWAKLQKHITRKPGGISVAPVSDPRPAYVPVPVIDQFEDLTAEALV